MNVDNSKEQIIYEISKGDPDFRLYKVETKDERIIDFVFEKIRHINNYTFIRRSWPLRMLAIGIVAFSILMSLILIGIFQSGPLTSFLIIIDLIIFSAGGVVIWGNLSGTQMYEERRKAKLDSFMSKNENAIKKDLYRYKWGIEYKMNSILHKRALSGRRYNEYYLDGTITFFKLPSIINEAQYSSPFFMQGNSV